jgi:GTP-binding protein EngB required for normal cell division
VNRSSIAHALETVEEFLEEHAVFLLPAETRKNLRERVQSLLEKARCPGELLYVGILGGTGVGKSTLINALARKEISSSSDRRPFTDQAVVYRHRAASPALDKFQHLLRTPDAIHDSETIRDLALLDLPDFDSQEQANRRTVLEILPALDSVVWVVSPEKYADAAFYRFVKQTAISQENFTFVFNKADEVLGVNESQRHQVLKEVLGDLAFRLTHEAGIEQPRIFSVSALREFGATACDGVLRTDFRKLRDFLMGKKDAKEIASIKTVNLMGESARLLDDLNREIQPEEKARAILSIRERATGRLETATATSVGILEEERRLFRSLFLFLIHEDPSIGPVRAGMSVLRLGRARNNLSGADGLEPILRDLAERIWNERRLDLETMADSAESELIMSLGRTEAFPSRKDPSSLVIDARKQAYAFVAQWIEDKQRERTVASSRLLRLIQKAILFGPVLLLVLKLLGPDHVGRWLEHPSLSTAFMMAVSCLTSFFGSEGLIGLTALLLCEALLIWYLGSKRLKKIDKMAREVTREAVTQLQRRLDAVFESVETERTETLQRIEEGLERLGSINSAVLAKPAWRNVEIPSKTLEPAQASPAMPVQNRLG